MEAPGVVGFVVFQVHVKYGDRKLGHQDADPGQEGRPLVIDVSGRLAGAVADAGPAALDDVNFVGRDHPAQNKRDQESNGEDAERYAAGNNIHIHVDPRIGRTMSIKPGSRNYCGRLRARDRKSVV